MGLLFLGLLLVGLIHFSAPKNQLEPYDKFKEDAAAQTAAVDESSAKKDDPISVMREEIDEDLITPVVDASPPDSSTLSRETIQHLAKGMKLVEEGKYGSAEHEFEQAAKLSPESPEVFSIWGAALRMEKKYTGANKRFAKAYELSPNDEEITFNWGLSRLAGKEHDEAIKLFKKTIELNPEHYMAYNYLGKSYGRKKMLVEERKNYEQALEIKPDFAQAHFNLAVVLSLQKQFDAATPHFQKAIELDKSFELPFVIQFLTAQGVYKGSKGKAEAQAKAEKAKAGKAKAEQEKEMQTAKLDPTQNVTKSEGSDHKMEGSGAKGDKDFTNVTGTLLINGQPAGDGIGVVFVEPKDKMRVPDQHTQQVSIRQSDLQFLPKHTVVQVGSTVTFVNEDREVHNIYSKSLNNQFNLGAMAAGTSKTLQFISAGPVILRCNLHKDMVGTLFVAPNGYYMHPDASGKFSFPNLKNKEYHMQAWHPRFLPEEVQNSAHSLDLKGIDQTMDIQVKSDSQPGDINDLVDETDYAVIVDNIETLVYKAIDGWKLGQKHSPGKNMLIAITKHYDGEGLKGAIAKSFSQNRSDKLEQKLDDIRKKISGIGFKEEDITEESLKSEAKIVITQLRANVQELQLRKNPTP